MSKNLRNFYILFFVIIILVTVGFLILIYKVNNLELWQNNLTSTQTSTIEIQNNQDQLTTSSLPTSSLEVNNTTTSFNFNNLSVSINSNVFFNAIAHSISNEEQYAVTIMINKVTKNNDGSLVVGVKVFTDTANNYSSLDIENLIQIFNQNGTNTYANKIVGAFKAMQPQSSIDGYLNFSNIPQTNTIILQLGPADNPVFYQFDFSKGTYEQISVG